MPRIRSIKPEFFSSPSTGAVSFAARHLYTAMWTLADDWGVGEAHPKMLAAYAFPYDDIGASDIEELLKEIVAHFHLVLFRNAGRTYFQVMNWEEHQVTRQRGERRNPTVFDASSQVIAGVRNVPDSVRTRTDSVRTRTDSVRTRTDSVRKDPSRNIGTGEHRNIDISMRTFGDPKDAPRAEHTDDAPESTMEQPALVDAPEAPHNESQDRVSGDPVGDPDPNQPSRHEQPDTPQADTPPAQPTGSRYSKEFETWWDGYPVKRGKAKAYKAFRKARRRASLETLTQGRDRYAAWLAAHPDRPPKWAEGWLNGDRWEDDLTVGDPTDSGGGGGVIDMWRKAQELHASRPGLRSDWTTPRDGLEPENYSPPPQLAATIAHIAAGFGAG